MAKIANIQEVSLTKLKPYKNNAKIHGKEQVQKIAESIKAFGFLSPCLIDEEMNLIAGHGRVMAAKELGMESVPCLFIEGLSEEQRKAYILADNKLTEMGSWNLDLVSQELEELKASGFNIDLTGFSIDDILFDDEEIYLPETEEETEGKKEPRIKRGQVWKLGRHRLMCGDSTKIEDVIKLTNGEEMDMVEMDPPYNVYLGITDIKEAKIRRRRLDKKIIENDSMSDEQFYEFIRQSVSNARQVLKPGGAFYMWISEGNGLTFRQAMEDAGIKIREVLAWVKNSIVMGRQDYQRKHESCLYGWKDGAGHYFIDMRSLPTVEEFSTIEKKSREELIQIIKDFEDQISTIQHEPKPTTSKDHPSMKPLNLIRKHIRNSSRPEEKVLDLFGGSGTTLIACEEMERSCFMMEYDEEYAETIIQRWEELTNEKAKMVK